MRRHNSMMSVLSGLLAVGLVVGLSAGSALAATRLARSALKSLAYCMRRSDLIALLLFVIWPIFAVCLDRKARSSPHFVLFQFHFAYMWQIQPLEENHFAYMWHFLSRQRLHNLGKIPPCTVFPKSICHI